MSHQKVTGDLPCTCMADNGGGSERLRGSGQLAANVAEKHGVTCSQQLMTVIPSSTLTYMALTNGVFSCGCAVAYLPFVCLCSHAELGFIASLNCIIVHLLPYVVHVSCGHYHDNSFFEKCKIYMLRACLQPAQTSNYTSHVCSLLTEFQWLNN